MSYNLNKVKIEKLKGKYIFLIDASAFCRLEELALVTGMHLMLLMKNSSKVHFLLTNEVWVELMNGPRVINPKLILDHIINVEGSMSYDLKENRFLIEEEGEIKYIVLNKISAQDYNQVLLCQNHPEMILVSNDKKLLKSAGVILKERVIGVNALMERMIELEPEVKEYETLKDEALKLFELKKIN